MASPRYIHINNDVDFFLEVSRFFDTIVSVSDLVPLGDVSCTSIRSSRFII